MKNKLIIFLSILIILSLSACGKDAPAAEVIPPASPTEQTETVAPQESERPEVTKDTEQEETPAEPEKEAPQEQEASTELSPEEQKTEDKPEETNADQTNNDVDPGDAEQAPIPEETVLTQKDYHIVLTEDLILDIPAGTEVTPDYLDYLEIMSSAIILPAGDSFGETETPPVEETPVEEPEPYTPPTALSDAEVQKVVNDYLDNFETYVDVSGWDTEAIEKLDENIEIIKTNPPSIIANAIKDYQEGNAKKDKFEFLIRTFLEQGGYGSQDITVQ